MIDNTHTTPAPPPSPIPDPGPAQAGASAASPGVHPYAAPAVIFRTPLEAVAASCYSAPGKADLISCLVGNS